MQYEILFNTQEFSTPDGVIKISSGDSFIVDSSNPIFIIGYGTVNGEHGLRCLYKDIDGSTSFISIFKLREDLLYQRIKLRKVVESENNKLFNKRIIRPHDISILEEFISKLQGIRIKGKGSAPVERKFKKLTEFEMIGDPDWFVLFKISTNFGGNLSLSKIATLTNEFKGQVFLTCQSLQGCETIKNSNSTFFCLSGVNITPEQCLFELESLFDF